jgi:hypothetical protein
MLDGDLAAIYGVSTSRFNEAVKRNKERFPPDFMFQLTVEENASLRSQFAILETGRGRHRKYRPYVFTEYGALMAANILNSPRAVQMNTTCGDAVGWTALVAWCCDRASRESASQHFCCASLLAEYDEQQKIPTKHLLTYFYEICSICYYEFNKDRYGIIHNKGPGRNPSLVAKGFRN